PVREIVEMRMFAQMIRLRFQFDQANQGLGDWPRKMVERGRKVAHDDEQVRFSGAAADPNSSSGALAGRRVPGCTNGPLQQQIVVGPLGSQEAAAGSDSIAVPKQCLGTLTHGKNS